jgi:hypothetical protein
MKRSDLEMTDKRCAKCGQLTDTLVGHACGNYVDFEQFTAAMNERAEMVEEKENEYAKKMGWSHLPAQMKCKSVHPIDLIIDDPVPAQNQTLRGIESKLDKISDSLESLLRTLPVK